MFIPRRFILLVGPTQAGKSTVANFLVAGSSDAATNKFEVGDGTKSCTQLPKCEKFTYNWGANTCTEYSVLDTAGAGDSGNNDLDNMIELYKHLLEEDTEISCVILVVKYPTLVDNQYKRIIDFYKKMLSTAFNKKIILVITHTEMQNERWINRQKRTGNDPHRIVRNIATTICTLAGLDEIQYYAFDALANPDDFKDWKHAMECRDKILQLACKYSPGFRATELTFQKSIRWQKHDKSVAKQLTVKRDSLSSQIKEAETDVKEWQGKIIQGQKDIAGLVKAISKNIEAISGYNSDEMTEIFSTCIKEPWWYWSHMFDYHLSYNIAKVEISGSTFKYNIVDTQVTGVVEKKFWVPLEATLKVFGYSKDVHAKDILMLQNNVNIMRQDKQNQEVRHDAICSEYIAKVNKRDALEKEYINLGQQIEIRNKDSLSHHEVRNYVTK